MRLETISYSCSFLRHINYIFIFSHFKYWLIRAVDVKEVCKIVEWFFHKNSWLHAKKFLFWKVKALRRVNDLSPDIISLYQGPGTTSSSSFLTSKLFSMNFFPILWTNYHILIRILDEPTRARDLIITVQSTYEGLQPITVSIHPKSFHQPFLWPVEFNWTEH